MSESSDPGLPPPGAPPPATPPPTAPPPGPPPGGVQYPARFEVAYSDSYNRLTTAFRIILVIPIVILVGVLTSGLPQFVETSSGEWGATSGGGIAGGLFVATLLMILFRRRYPRWWFDFGVELSRFTARIGAYVVLVTDKYPSTVDEQDVRLEYDYPDAERDLNRWLPLVKWFLLIPHYIVLFFLSIGAFVCIVIAWFAILFTGRYPRGLFDFVVGVGRWSVRINAYGFLLITDRYPPFSLR